MMDLFVLSAKTILRTLTAATFLASTIACGAAVDHAIGPIETTDAGNISALTNGQQGLKVSARQIVDLSSQQGRVLKLDLTRDANDVWDRIRRGFGIPDYDGKLVAELQTFYLDHPGFLHKVFERGGPYLYYILDELERRGLPAELALLPMIESSYNPFAYSRSKAAGLWQFIPSTGRNFNLAQNKWIDERRDIIASTNAALDYLEYIYDMHGDWQLTLAAYNCGEGAIGRAIKNNLAAGLPADFDNLKMPAQTQRYLPKLQAIKNIVAQPERFGLELPYVPNDLHFTTVAVPQGLDLASAADMADMPLEEFISLNPGYKLPAVMSANETLVIPADRQEKFQLRLSERDETQRHWRIYSMKRGDTLAAVAKRFNLSTSQLQQLNGLNRTSKVGTGYSLLVPDGRVDSEKALAALRLLAPR